MSAVRGDAALQWREPIFAVAAVVVSAVLLMAPALWNGYPLFYYDSVDYVRGAFTWDLPVWRTVPYTLMGMTARITGTMWTVPALQSLIVAYAMYEALRVFTRLSPALALLPVIFVLVLFTGLPWFTSQVMADAFTGVVVLGIAMLAFAPDRLGKWRGLLIAGLVALGAAFHTSHLAIAGGLVVVLAALRVVGVGRSGWLVPRLLLPVAALAASCVLVLTIHWATLGKPFIAQPSSVLMLGRLVQDGMAKRYLDEVCPRMPSAMGGLCAHRDKLPRTANDFLWGRTPFWKLGGFYGLEPVAKRILSGTLDEYPLRHAETALRLSAEQFAMIETGDGFVDMRWHIRETMATYYPHEYCGFIKARQQMGGGIGGLNRLHVPFLIVALAGTVVMLAVWARRRQSREFGLALVVLVAILGNAFVCGALSNPNHRYQSRIAWLPVLVVAVALCRRLENRGIADGRVMVTAAA